MDEDMRRTSRAMSVGSVDAPSSSNLFEVFPGLTNSTDSQVSIVENQKLLNSAQLRDLWVLIKNPNNGIMFQNHRYRLRTYPDCIIGSELVDWLIQNDKAAQRVQAVAIGKALLDAKWIKCVTSSYQEGFVDGYALYCQGELAESQDLLAPQGSESENPVFGEFMEPVWFRDIHQDDDINSEDDLLGMPKLSPPFTKYSV
nr:1-phosphatidylinositol 3-phosphate 5-kinase-like [Lytechinus pictus]